MTKNYDNWARLVTAVVRRERDKQIALSHSTDTSTITSTSSSFNLITVDYSDLTLDQTDSWTMLPSDRREVAWRSSASLSFFLDQRTGKKCFLLGASKLEISSGDGITYCWEYKSHPKSRFAEVAELTESAEVYIQGRIKTQTLSPETLYESYLVFGFTDKCEKVHRANSTVAIFCVERGYYFKVQDFIVQFQPGNARTDGWMETELGNFFVDDLGRNGGVTVQLQDTSGSMQRGLIVEGIEFRPLVGNENKKQIALSHSRNSSSIMDYPDLTLDHNEWEVILSPDKQEATWRLASLNFFLDGRTGKKCLMLGARELMILWGDIPWYWKWTTHADSRFPDVAELKDVCRLDIRGKIKTSLLSPKTTYAAFLVFKLAEGYVGLEVVNAMIKFLDESEKDAEKWARTLHLRMAVSRMDGWMETDLGNFYVDQGVEREVEARLLETRRWKTGLIVEGIEFRPIYVC